MKYSSVLLALVLCPFVHGRSLDLTPVQGNAKGIVFRIRATRFQYAESARVLVSVELVNEGSEPAYVPRELAPCPTYYGGIVLTITGADKKVSGRKCGDPFRMNFAGRDVHKVASEELILLYPKYSYSYMLVADEVPSRAGSYTLTATLVPPSFTAEEKLALKSLPYRAVLQELRAQAKIIRNASR